ncbi:MAG TPA: complex I NDUFA9 subunit family protein [Caulobacteraceae bacterium]|jgi:NADH dehydrogenase|nr:complex I NDUFA9 subunit family protein [Caulobacteraceae bacterium]
MRGLVTLFGGSGFIGSQAVRALAKQGWRIRVAVRRPWQAYQLRMLGDVGQIEIVQANVRVAASVERALEGAEACVYTAGTPFESGAQNFAALRSEGPATVAQAAARAGVRNFVFISGIGAEAHSPSKAARATAEGEAAVWAAIPGAVILRPSVVFGPGDAFFTKMAAMAVPSPVMPVFHAATRMQPVFVADVARAVAAALHDPAAEGRTFELGGPSVYTLRELTELTLAVIGRPRTLIDVPTPIAGLIGGAGDLIAFLRSSLPMLLKPPMTTDQLALLSVDNIVAPGAAGLADLGVAATAAEPIIPTYLYPFRKGGQYADLTPPPEPVRV